MHYLERPRVSLVELCHESESTYCTSWQLQWRIQGRFVGFERTPLLAQVTSVSLCTMNPNSKESLTVAHLGEFLVDHLPSNATDDFEHAVCDRKWAWSTQKWAWLQEFRARFARIYSNRTPLCRILDPPLLIDTRLQKHRGDVIFAVFTLSNVKSFSQLW